MLVPGKVENWVVVVDCQQLPPIQPVLLEELVENLTVAYPTMLERMYLVNGTAKLTELLDFVKIKLSRLTASKIEVLDAKQSRNLDRYLHAEELEQRFGGRLPNLKEYWPIRSTNRLHLDETFEQPPSEQPPTDEAIEFKSVLNDSAYFR